MLIFIACLCDSTGQKPALHGLAFTVVANVFALFLGLDETKIRSGLFGFNPFLAGAGLTFFRVPRDADSPTTIFHDVLIHAFLPCFVVIIQVGLGGFTNRLLKSPAFTLPFNMVMMMYISHSYAPGSNYVFYRDGSYTGATPGGVTNPNVLLNGPVSPPSSLSTFSFWVDAGFRGFGQVFFASDTLPGILIFLAIMLYSRLSSLFGLSATLLGGFWSFFTNTFVDGIRPGLWGFNTVLTGIAFGGVFFCPVNSRSAVVWLLAVLLSALFQGVINSLSGSAFLLPSGTVGFCLASILVMGMKDGNGGSGLLFVPDGEGGTPEENCAKARTRSSGGSSKSKSKSDGSSAAAAEKKDDDDDGEEKSAMVMREDGSSIL